MQIDKRLYQRTPVNWEARCFTSAERFWNTTIVDTSEGGFGLSEALPLNVGESLRISVDGIGVFPCRIAWKNSTRCGVVLLDEKQCMSMEDILILDGVFSDVDTLE